MDNHFGETQSINNQRWLRAKRGSSMNHDEGTYGCDGVCVMNPRWDGTHVGPTEGRFFRIYLMAAQLQHALITFIHFFFPSFWLSPLPYPFIFPLFVFSRYLSIITFSLSLILSCTHSLITPPTSPLHNQSSLSTLSLSLKIKTKHVLCHIPSGTRRVARKIGGVQDQRQGQAWPQDPSHYRQTLPR